MEITPKGAVKLIGGIVATILLGAIGSGVWERILSPAANWVYRASVNFVNSISTGYKDRIYQAASQGFHEAYSLKIFALFSLLLALYLMMSSQLRLLRILDTNNATDKITSKKWFARLMVILSISISLLIFYSVNKHEAINNITTYSIRSLDTLRPYIGDQFYLKLLSDFYQIRTASQFYQFNQNLITLSKTKNVVLPEFNPL
jgi:hypothetical protein